jgi:hypothetical protein
MLMIEPGPPGVIAKSQGTGEHQRESLSAGAAQRRRQPKAARTTP